MSKIIDITEKLNFEESPVLRVKSTDIVVNDDASTLLKVMGVMDEDNVTNSDVLTIYELLFSKTERKKIGKLQLKFNDFVTLVKTAIEVVTGEGTSEGE